MYWPHNLFLCPLAADRFLLHHPPVLGAFSSMKKTTANIEVNPSDIESIEDINALKAQMIDMQMEIDILKETINVLKKDPGIDQTALTNREKAVIIAMYSAIEKYTRYFERLEFLCLKKLFGE